MTIFRSLNLYTKISRSWLKTLGLTCLFHGPQAFAEERVLDLSFWSADQSHLVLGGLWEFYADRLLQAKDRTHPSDLLAEISQPWTRFRALTSTPLESPPTKASYAMLIKGFVPRTRGYTIQIQLKHAPVEFLVFPKYAPELQRQSAADDSFFWRRWIPEFCLPKLSLHFSPQSKDEIWVIVMHRLAAENGENWATPWLMAGTKAENYDRLSAQ